MALTAKTLRHGGLSKKIHLMMITCWLIGEEEDEEKPDNDGAEAKTSERILERQTISSGRSTTGVEQSRSPSSSTAMLWWRFGSEKLRLRILLDFERILLGLRRATWCFTLRLVVLELRPRYKSDDVSFLR